MPVSSDIVAPVAHRGDLIDMLPLGDLYVVSIGTVCPEMQKYIASHSGLDTFLMKNFDVAEYVVFDAGGEFAELTISAAMGDLTQDEDLLSLRVVDRFLEFVTHYEDKAAMIGDIVMMVTFDGLCEDIMHRIYKCIGDQLTYLFVKNTEEQSGKKLSEYRKACISLFAVMPFARYVLNDRPMTMESLHLTIASMINFS